MSVDCQVCKPPALPVHEGPGFPIEMPGTRHRSNCPLVPQLSDEAKQRIREAFEESARARRRAMESAHTYVIGGGS